MNNKINYKLLMKMKKKAMKMEKKTIKMKKKLMKKKIKYKFKFRLNKKKFLLNYSLYKSFIIFFLISLYGYYIIYNINQVKIITVKNPIFQEIVSFENDLNLTPKIFDEFRKINCDNKLLEENIKFKKSWFPDISIIITIYNQAEFIHKALRSVQNQSLKNIEIIFIDDCSLDNSLEIIKEYQKEDERIILISHDTNEGEIKSRTDGIRTAKGKYITIIDGDDALIHKDILKNSLYIAQKANLDVVEFISRIYFRKHKPKNYDYASLNVTHILYQPELKEKFFQKIDKNRYYLMNRVIWAKLIKRKVFKQLLDYIGSEYVDDYINEAEDTLMAVGLFNFAKSYYVMKEVGYYYSSEGKKQAKIIENKVCKVNNKLKKMGFFKYLKFLIEHTSINDDDKIRTYSEFSVLSINKIFVMILDDRHYKLIFYVLDKLLEWNCLEQSQRINIINFKNKVIDKRNKDNSTNINLIN